MDAHVMSTESAPVEAPAPVADMVSKESYDALKMQLEAKTKSEAAREQRLQRFEEMERKKLVAMQPSIQELAELEVKENPEYAELASVDAWAKELHQTQNVEANLGIARLISCNSARFKRTLDEASAGKESASMLASTLKELEEIKADRDAKALLGGRSSSRSRASARPRWKGWRRSSRRRACSRTSSIFPRPRRARRAARPAPPQAARPAPPRVRAPQFRQRVWRTRC